MKPAPWLASVRARLTQMVFKQASASGPAEMVGKVASMAAPDQFRLVSERAGKRYYRAVFITPDRRRLNVMVTEVLP